MRTTTQKRAYRLTRPAAHRNRNPRDGAAMSFREIAQALGISTQAVHESYQSAMRKLREQAVLLAIMRDTATVLDSMRHNAVDESEA